MRLLSLALTFTVLAATPAAARISDEAPRAPEGSAANQTIPLRDAGGAYLTPNRDLTANETAWHVRAALNVAALGCRDAAEAQTIAAYNGMIARHQVALAEADAGVKATYRERFGDAWEAEHDTRMTRVYNFFAQPPAQRAFCAVARTVLDEVQQVAPDQFAMYAAEALPRLEAPFTDFYRAYDAWKVDYAAWQARGQAPVAVAAVSAAPVSAGGRTLFP